MRKKHVVTLIGCVLSAWVSVNQHGVMMVSPRLEQLPEEFRALAVYGPVTTPNIWHLNQDECAALHARLNPPKANEKDL